MGMKDLESALERIRRIPGYRQPFESAFGPGDVIAMSNAAKAIASYERTLITPGSAFDRYVAGDKSALTQRQIAGMKHFQTVGCAACHQLKDLPDFRDRTHYSGWRDIKPARIV
jgi:cytochrome c peroxidase